MGGIKTYNDATVTYDSVSVAYSGAEPEGVIYKVFGYNTVLTAADLDKYIMNQVVMSFPNAADRDEQLGEYLTEGMVAFLQDSGNTYHYDGSGWTQMGYTKNIAADDSKTSLLQYYFRS
jgi:hypothetical protein